MSISLPIRTNTNPINLRRTIMDSIWTKTVEKPRFDALDGNRKTEVLIVGGGIAGILCAYKLKNAGVDCMLVEADEICGGITKNTRRRSRSVTGLYTIK